ncbi:hypothetical protein QQZ08_009413 [Neonectria magnoliae]|uniref:Uncharacterized protein n=1 Tax=Neonectria magnoliae TaxID=2732573 RepID=A0ABR1HN72_9HYPO
MCVETKHTYECGCSADKTKLCPIRQPQSWWACCLPSPPECKPKFRLVSDPGWCPQCNLYLSAIPMGTVSQPARSHHSSSSSSRHNKQRHSPRTTGGDGGTRDGGRRALEDARPEHRPAPRTTGRDGRARGGGRRPFEDAGPARPPPTRRRSEPQQMGGYTGWEHYYPTTNHGGQGVGLGIYQSQGGRVTDPTPVAQPYSSHPAMAHEPQQRAVSPLTESEAMFSTRSEEVLPYDEYQYRVFH